MSALLLLLPIAAAALLAMRLAGLRGPLLTLAAAALALGGAGYALSGRPGMAGVPRAQETRAPPLPLAAARSTLMGQFNTADRWLIIADSYAGRGATADAVGVVRSGLRAHPDDYILWVGLGNALSDHARAMTVPAAYAFDRAQQLAPRAPGPRFFRGLALVRSGQVEAGAAEWRALIATAPANARWRPLVEGALATVTPPRR